MKKFISLLIALCISISIVPQISLTVFASEASGTCGENLTWELVGNILTISGEGDMDNFTVSESLEGSPAPWRLDMELEVIIAEGVTSIGTYAFTGMTIEDMELPESLKHIGSRAFWQSRFGNTDSGNGFVFKIPSGVAHIGQDAFFCSGVTQYNVSDDNEYYCDVDGHLFSKDKKTFMRFADHYGYIEENFNNHYTVPEGVTKIESYAFYGCRLNHIAIANSVAEIGDYAFGGYQLYGITTTASNQYFCSVNGVLFTKDKTRLIRYPARRTENSYTIPDGVKVISPGAFEYTCEGLYIIDIPQSVEIIGDKAFARTAVGAVAIPYGVTTIEEGTFYDSAIENIYLPVTVAVIKIDAFKYCYNLTDFYYGGSREDIKNLKAANDNFGSNDAIIKATVHYNSVPADVVEYKPPLWYSGKFQFSTEEGKGETDFNYGDFYFFENEVYRGDGYWYNHNLAKISMRLALSSFAKKTGSDNNKDYSKQFINAENLLKNMGFTNIEHNSDYEEKPWDNGIGVIAGHKKVNYDGEKYTILAVTIRGGNYETEWAGNFNVGNDTDNHEGFEIARNSTIQFIQEYIDFNELEGNLKLWITGYSRAGATANLTAAYFDEYPERLPEEVILTPENIFAYCFEPPAGALYPDNESGLYNNIFNIVNQHDFVPMVAMRKWGYDRYGITKYLPSAVTSGNYGNLVSDMEEYYETYCKEKYIVDNFTYYYNAGELTEALEQGLNNQGVFLEKIIDTLAIAMQGPNYYKKEFQDVISKWVGEEVLGKGNIEPLLDSIDDEFGKKGLNLIYNWVVISNPFTPTVSGIRNVHYHIRDALKKAFKKVGTPITDNALDTLGELIFELGYNNIETIIKNGKNLKQGHYPELCMAWLDAIDESDFTTRRLRTFYLNCDVDVGVYDSNGVLTAAIINNIPQKIEGSTMVAFVDENGQKIIYLPEDEEYQIKVKATADGNVTYSIQETDLETGDVKVTNYSNMSLKENDELIGTAENLSGGEADYPLLLNTETVTPEIIENAENYVVDVEIAGNGFTEGGGTFYKGEYVIVKAAPYNNETFLGWYNGDELVSTENEYRFAVENSITLTAEFTTNTCEIIFVADDEIVSSTQISNGATVTAPKASEKSGYNFDGWYLDKEYTLAFDETKPITDSAVVYAKYTVIPSKPVSAPSGGGGGGISTYTIKFETNGGSKIENIKIARNKTVDEPIVPVKGGYLFTGWYADEELKTAYDFDSKVTKDFTLYAKWEKLTDEQPVEFKNPFSDVNSDDWYYEDVLYAVKNGLFNGTTESKFSPDTYLTRAMLVTVLYRAEGEPEITNEIIFNDIDKDSYYEKAIMWAEKNGIVNGISKTKFAPDQNITREQIAAIMYRYAHYKEYDVSIGETTNILSYDDFTQISEYAYASMQYSVGSGLMKGKTLSTLNPLDFATRGEIAAVLHRFIEADK